MSRNLVRRGGKDDITVATFKDTYQKMNSEAERKRRNTHECINLVLKQAIERDEFLQAYALFSLKVGYEGSVLIIKDSKLGKTAEVYLKDQTLYCNICDSRDCNHIHFALALPETARLYLRRPSK